MKKILLVLLCIGFATFSMANENWFTKKVVNKKQIITERLVHEGNRTIGATTSMVPTLTKESIWDSFTQVWGASSSIVHVYSNDLLIVDYELNYSQTDTSSRTLYTYNSNNKLTQVLVQEWQSPGVYTNMERKSYSYFNNNLGSIETAEYWLLGANTWNYQYRRTLEKDAKGNVIKHLSENYNNGSWQMNYGYTSTITYLNNTSSKIIDVIDSAYFSISKKFEIDTKYSRTYNANDQMETEKYYSVPKLTDTLVLRNIDSIYYSNNIPTTYISYDIINSILMKDYKIDSIIWQNYNPSLKIFENKLLSAIESYWNNSMWEPNNRLRATFPDNNGSTINLYDLRDGNNWVLAARETELFDDRFNITETSQETYDLNTSSWTYTNGGKRGIMYDASNNITEEIYAGINPNTNSWENTRKFEYLNYITISTGINTSKNTLEVTLYPNPSADGKVSVNVKMETTSELSIKITDLKGSVVYTDKKELGKGLNTIELNGLQQGMYILELITEFGSGRNKILVK